MCSIAQPSLPRDAGNIFVKDSAAREIDFQAIGVHQNFVLSADSLNTGFSPNQKIYNSLPCATLVFAEEFAIIEISKII